MNMLTEWEKIKIDKTNNLDYVGIHLELSGLRGSLWLLHRRDDCNRSTVLPFH